MKKDAKALPRSGWKRFVDCIPQAGCLGSRGMIFTATLRRGIYQTTIQLFMYTIGINAAFHDSAACIIKDGQLLAAAEEERFTHVKHGKRPIPFSTYELPFHAISY